MIIGYEGAFGSGKTWSAVIDSLHKCQVHKKYLVTNQPLNLDRCLQYAGEMGWDWVRKLILRGGIIQIVPDGKSDYRSRLLASCQIANTVVLLDECGVWFPAHNQRATPDEFINRLLQQRKGGIDFIWISQDVEILDPRFLRLSEYIIHCESNPLWPTSLKKENGKPYYAQLIYQVEAAGYQSFMKFIRQPQSFLTTLMGQRGCGVRFRLSSPRSWGLYDTNQTLGTVEAWTQHSLKSEPVTGRYVSLPDTPTARLMYFRGSLPSSTSSATSSEVAKLPASATTPSSASTAPVPGPSWAPPRLQSVVPAVAPIRLRSKLGG